MIGAVEWRAIGEVLIGKDEGCVRDVVGNGGPRSCETKAQSQRIYSLSNVLSSIKSICPSKI